MKTLFSFIALIFCLAVTAQDINNTLVIDPQQLDSFIVNGKKYYKLNVPLNTTVNTVQATVATHTTDIASIKTTATQQANNIATAQGSINIQSSRIDGLDLRVNNLEANGSPGTSYYTSKTVSSRSYTLLPQDYGKTIIMTNSSTSTVILPNNLFDGFWCQVKQAGATVTISGNSTSKFSYKRTQTLNAVVRIECEGTTYTLHGDLK